MNPRLMLNGMVFQLGWFIAVIAAARGQPMLATIAPLGVVAVHLLQSSNPRLDLRLIAAAAALGLLGESLLINLGLTHYATHLPLAAAAPAWVVTLWMAFGTLPNLALRWFRAHLALTAILGAIFGPLTYLGGERLGAGGINEPFWLGIGCVGLMWAIAAPVLLMLATKWEAETEPSPGQSA